MERRAKPTLLLAEELAPGSDLAEAMADERAGDEGRPDTLAQAVEAFTKLAEALEFSMGVEASLAHLRAMNAVQVERACTLGWAYRDAEAAVEQAELKLRTAKAAGYDGLLDGMHEEDQAQPREVDGVRACRPGGGRRGAGRPGGARLL